jgi:hypothetical protein
VGKLHPLTLTLPLIPAIARLLIGLTDDVILPRGSIDVVAVPEPQTPFIFGETNGENVFEGKVKVFLGYFFECCCDAKLDFFLVFYVTKKWKKEERERRKEQNVKSNIFNKKN